MTNHNQHYVPVGQCPACGGWHTSPLVCPAQLSNAGASYPLVDEVEVLRSRLAEAVELLREARDDVVEASNHTHKPHAVAYYKDQIARIDAFLASDSPPHRENDA